MAKNMRKGSEYNNINETWDNNERKRADDNSPGREPATDNPSGTEDLNRVIKEEAAEYDQVNKEERLLGGDRATLNDDQDTPAANE